VTTTVALADPADLWRRWATLSAVHHAIGYEDTWFLSTTAVGLHHDDGGGNWAHLTLVEGGRAVLYGYDHEYSATADADPPLDLLAGAPAWLPWDDLLPYAARDELGYVLWHSDGAWHRVSYPPPSSSSSASSPSEASSPSGASSSSGASSPSGVSSPPGASAPDASLPGVSSSGASSSDVSLPGVSSSGVSVPGAGGLRDGLLETAGAVLEESVARDELVEFVYAWGEHDVDTPQERDEVTRAAAGLLRAFSPQALRTLLARLVHTVPDLRAGVAAATRAGLTPDAPPPLCPAGNRPERRRVRKRSDGEHDRLVWAAMREETEKDRTPPVDTGELGALITWLRSRAPARDGRCSLLVYADGSSLAAHRGDHPPAERPGEGNFDFFRELSDLVRRLRAAEADDHYGRWLFLRIETTADTTTVERRYDSWPPWWEEKGGAGPWRSNLRTELNARDTPWRPAWTPLLDPSVAYRPA
jgi:hypothetical protein